MKQETKEEINKHLEGFKKYVSHKYVDSYLGDKLKDYQKKHNLIPSIEVGKWYKNCSALIKFTKDDGSDFIYGYGFDFQGEWIDNTRGWDKYRNWVEATKEEWESMLLKKAKKDYPKGTKFKNDRGVIQTVEKPPYFDNVGNIHVSSPRNEWSDSLRKGSSNPIIYYNSGVWAEIVEEVNSEDLKLKELETKMVNMRTELKRMRGTVQRLRKNKYSGK
jgi:hypothetical protein